MITATLKIFGFSAGSWHIALPIDLPVEHYKFGAGPIQVEVTLGPRAAVVAPHSKAAEKVPETEVSHEPAHPDGVWD